MQREWWLPRSLLWVFLLLLPVGVQGQAAASGPAQLKLVGVQDSLGQFVYWYEATVDPASQGGVSSLSLALDATPEASGPNIEAEGGFLDLTTIRSPSPLQPFARVGPISPAPWKAMLDGEAVMTWHGRESGWSTLDSIAPGDTLRGFGLRSHFLPGIRTFRIQPTIQACCALPWGTEEENPENSFRNPTFFQTTTAPTIGPRYTPGGMVLDSLDAQVEAACSELLWIDDPEVCDDVSAFLHVAREELKRGRHPAAGRAMESVRALVASNRTPRGGVNDHAYWMLSLNAEHLRSEYESRQDGRLSFRLTLTEIEDSSSYSIYRYEVANASTSSWSVAAIGLDVGANDGTPASLPATGEFLDMTVGTNAVQRLKPYAQVGPISPEPWWAVLGRTADIQWYAPAAGVTALDSIPPASSMRGFALRSTYLPAIARALAEPTWQSCCTVPDPETDENPSTSSFASVELSVAPRIHAAELTIDLLRTQLNTVCFELEWISDADLCESLIATLSPPSEGAPDLDRFLLLLAEGRRDRTVADNAYWLLHANGSQLRR